MKDMEKQKLSLEVGKWYRNGDGNDVYIQNTTELERWPFKGIEYYRDELEACCWDLSRTYSSKGIVAMDLDNVKDTGNLLYEIEEPDWHKDQNESQNVESSPNDSKSDRVFESGSRRDSDVGKPRISDLKPYTRERFGYHMALGAEKYGVGNFELGQPDDSSFSSIHRHLAALERGDMSEDHSSAILFGIQLILMNQERAGVPTDYFYKKLTKNK